MVYIYILLIIILIYYLCQKSQLLFWDLSVPNTKRRSTSLRSSMSRRSRRHSSREDDKNENNDDDVNHSTPDATDESESKSGRRHRRSVYITPRGEPLPAAPIVVNFDFLKTLRFLI